jgi:hypothetical protein
VRIHVLSPCTGKKTGRGPALDPERLHRWRAGRLSVAEAGPLTPAAGLYDGLGHRLMMRGIDAFRAHGAGELILEIVSAGLGLVGEGDPVPNYEATFVGLRGARREAWIRALDLPAGVAAAMARPADLRLVLLGREYLAAAGLAGLSVAPDDPPTIVLAAPSAAPLVPPGALHVPLAMPEARRFHATLIALKGELVRRLLSDAGLWRRPDVRELRAWRDAAAFLELCAACRGDDAT